jgi:hypothetical protein
MSGWLGLGDDRCAISGQGELACVLRSVHVLPALQHKFTLHQAAAEHD